MIRRVYKQADGSVRVLIPNERLRLPGETDTAFMDRIAAQDASKSGLDGLPYEDIDHMDLPPRKDRNDWVMEGRQVKVKAKPAPVEKP